MKFIINIKNESKAKQFLNFISEIPYIEIEKKTESETSVQEKKLPQEFFKPLKINKYIKFNRDEIYEDRLR